MQIIVRGTNIAVTPALRRHAEKKVGRLTRLLRDSARVEVIQHVQRELQVAEVIVQMNGLTLRAREETTDMFASVDAAVEKIERQLKRLKEKKRSPIHRDIAEPRRRSKGATSSAKEEPAPLPQSLPRRSLFTKPMTEEEAVLQMNASGEEIFIFHNVSTECINVLHRLPEGSLELIEPETG